MAIRVLYFVALLVGALGLTRYATGDGNLPSAEPRRASRVAAQLHRLPPAYALPLHRVQRVEARLTREIERGAFPGTALAVGVRNRVAVVSAHGRVGWTEGAEAVDAYGTLYDLASLTKAVATTTAVMLLVEDGRMELDAPLSTYLPEFAGGDEHRVTIRQLLTHTGGIRAGFDPHAETPREVLTRMISLEPTLPPGRDVLYSDVGFVLLWAAAERAAGEPLPALLRRRVFDPLGMRSTTFGPPVGCPQCAPTLRLSSGVPYRGGSYDYTARRLEGRAGNAGLFSTAHDLARFAALMANGGELDGVRVLREETIRTFLREQPGAGSRALGWQWFCREGTRPDWQRCEEPYAVGHTGVTGTSLWIEPRSGFWVVLLTNRVYEPRADVDMRELRRWVFGQVTGLEPRGNTTRRTVAD